MRHTNFNSIKVQLELVRLHIPFLGSRSFQFHKGTIRTFPCRDVYYVMRYFNSIKVQLEQPKTDARTSVFIFQFHKGTIRTPDTLPFRLLPLIFQFHKGTIRTLHRPRQRLSCHHFNSIKVQLEHTSCSDVSLLKR